MLPLRIIGAFLLPAVLATDELMSGQKKVKVPYPAPLPMPIPLPPPLPPLPPPLPPLKKATPYDVSEPVYTCPKPGYVLEGEDCVFTDTVPARFECPIGFDPEGPIGHPRICIRTTQPVLTCVRGHLIDGMCRVAEYADASLVCPPGIERTPEGACVRYEQVAPIERCPPHSNRIQGRCVEIDYHEPIYVCPAGTEQEGRKCRREIVTFKEKKEKYHHHHHRMLSESEAETADAEEDFNLRGQSIDMDGEEEEEDLFVDLPEHIFKTDNVPLGQPALQGRKETIESTWLPAYYEDYDDYEYYDSYDDHEWKQLEVPVAVPEVLTGKGGKKIKVPVTKVKEVKVKEVKIKVPKPPQQIIKVQYLPAEKVCEVGEKYGGSCVTQTQTSPIVECPTPLINGACVRKVVVPPQTTCAPGLDLVCPPRVPGHRCRCERIIEIPAVPTCPVGTLDHLQALCISNAPPKEYCPLGYFLDATGRTCTKRDVEAALCLFQVTYICPDCDKHDHHHHHHHH